MAVAFGPEELERASCFALLARPTGPAGEPLRQASALRHGFVHLRGCGEEVGLPALAPLPGRRARSCSPPAAVAEAAEELSFERYVATFHFRVRPAPSFGVSNASGTPCASALAACQPTIMSCRPSPPCGARQALVELLALDRACIATSAGQPCSSLRADAPAFVPQAVALSTAPPPTRWFVAQPHMEATEAGARVPPPPNSPPAVANLLASLNLSGPPPAPVGDPQVSFDDCLECLSLTSHASSTTAPPSVAEEEVPSPSAAAAFFPSDLVR